MAKPINTDAVDKIAATQTLECKNAQDAWTQFCIIRLRQKVSPGCSMKEFGAWWDAVKGWHGTITEPFIIEDETVSQESPNINAVRLVHLRYCNGAEQWVSVIGDYVLDGTDKENALQEALDWQHKQKSYDLLEQVFGSENIIR